MKATNTSESVSKSTSGKDTKITYTKRVTKGDTTTEWTVKQVENGYVISKYTSSDGKGGYKYDEKTYISATNPFEKQGPKVDLGTSLTDEFQFVL